MKIALKHHSIILLVGPTGCGKSTFAANLSHSIVNDIIHTGEKKPRVITLSSDEYRRKLLNNPMLHSHDPMMMEVSSQAFKVLMCDLEVHTSFPINTEFVIIDSRGFNESFRKEIITHAEKVCYNVTCVTFEYKEASEYRIGVGQIPGLGLDQSVIKAVDKDVQLYRRKILAGIRSRDFTSMITVKHKSACHEAMEIVLEDNWMFTQCVNHGISLPPDADPDTIFNFHPVQGQAIAVIADSHECVDELSSLLNAIHDKFLDVDKPKFIHLGDYLDKGNDTARMIEFMYQRVIGFGDSMIQANHEAYTVRRLRGEIDPNPELEATYFTALNVLMENEELKQKFFRIWDASVPFMYVQSPGMRSLMITHAPVEERYMGKLTFGAIRAQRNFRIKDREKDVREELAFLFDEADTSKPLHVFGHVSHNSPKPVYKNKIFLDTGAVFGGKLTAMIYHQNQYSFMQVDCAARYKADLPNNLTTPLREDKPFNIRDYDLEPDDIRYLKTIMRTGVKYISGTMAPAPSANGKLEPLHAGLDYFRKRGVSHVVLQPKYMGSRCQLYLRKGVDQVSMGVSRNGHVITRVGGMEDLIASWLSKVDGWFDGNWTEIILDGELLPWAAMGQGLIDHQFKSYEALVTSELETLSEDTAFAKLDIAERFDVVGRLKDIKAFSDNLALYTKDIPLEFKAFDILSVDGKVYHGSADTIFKVVNDDKIVVIDLAEEVAEEQLKIAMAFFDELTVGNGMEGVVIKPLVPQEGVPPYMKVRNEHYLTLIYGYDYQRRYDRLLRQKNITGKVALSIKEHQLAMQMLESTPEQRKEMIVKMIGNLKAEKTLDPRL